METLYNNKQEELLLAPFLDGELPPAEDDRWYAVLADVDIYGDGDTTIEEKVLDILNRRGFHAIIDGERDSFGWVTRGIVVDGKVMCLD